MPRHVVTIMTAAQDIFFLQPSRAGLTRVGAGVAVETLPYAWRDKLAQALLDSSEDGGATGLMPVHVNGTVMNNERNSELKGGPR